MFFCFLSLVSQHCFKRENGLSHKLSFHYRFVTWPDHYGNEKQKNRISSLIHLASGTYVTMPLRNHLRKRQHMVRQALPKRQCWDRAACYAKGTSLPTPPFALGGAPTHHMAPSGSEVGGGCWVGDPQRVSGTWWILPRYSCLGPE